MRSNCICAAVLLATVSTPLLHAGDEKKLQMRVGRFATQIAAHPIVDKRQRYFDVYAKGEKQRQILVVFDRGVAPPPDRTRLVELTGELRVINLGGAPGTKGAYKGELLTVKQWKYLARQKCTGDIDERDLHRNVW